MEILSFIIAFSLIGLIQAEKVVKFGAIFDADDVFGQNVFDFAISRQNVFNSQFRLEPLIKRIPSMDAAKVEKAVCDLVESGATAIVGPKSVYMSDIVASLCNELNIPHIALYHRTREISKNPYHKFTRNIFPDSTLISRSLVDVVKSYGWKKFAIIYDSDESLIRLNGVLQMFPIGFKLVNIYKFPTNKDNMKVILKEMSKNFINRVIIDCSLENIAEIIRQGAEVKMMTDYMSYFITYPDGHMLNIPELKDVAANITAIRLMAEEDIEAINIVTNWKRTKMYLNVEQSRIADEIASPNQLKIEAALIRDSLTVLATALKQNRLFLNIDEPSTRCSALDNGIQIWNGGVDFLKNIDDGSAIGITGPIDFDRDFKTRQNFHMEVIQLDHDHKPFSWMKVAEWDARSGFHITRTSKEILSQRIASIHNKKFRVITRLTMPYLREVDPNSDLKGNDRYEGFIRDLMDSISAAKNFSYELIVEPKSHLGKYDPHSGRWDGMIGYILDGKADLAACDFTITHERKMFIDFSIPFMNLGISILYARSPPAPTHFFTFLNPLDTSVWLHMYTAFLFVSLSLYVVSKITMRDWENPHPCDDEPEELENIWNMRNCVWLSSGAIMQTGCDILPKGFGTRVTVVSWWFFALIVINTYTASLAAHYTKQQMEGSINSVQDLAKGHAIKYGVMAEGSTEAFFRDSNESIYQKMWAAMEHFEPSVILDSNEAGIARVEKDKRTFAFFMESSTIEYITQSKCDLIKVGSKLDDKSYGIGMPLNSPYRHDINQAILKLQEDRTIKDLHDKWWITKNIPIIDGVERNCTKDDNDSDALEISQIYGVFVVLAVGQGIALFAGVIDFLWNVRKISIEQKITPKEAFYNEFMFACKVWLTRKPVKQDSIELRESLSSSRSSEKS